MFRLQRNESQERLQPTLASSEYSTLIAFIATVAVSWFCYKLTFTKKAWLPSSWPQSRSYTRWLLAANCVLLDISCFFLILMAVTEFSDEGISKDLKCNMFNILSLIPSWFAKLASLVFEWILFRSLFCSKFGLYLDSSFFQALRYLYLHLESFAWKVKFKDSVNNVLKASSTKCYLYKPTQVDISVITNYTYMLSSSLIVYMFCYMLFTTYKLGLKFEKRLKMKSSLRDFQFKCLHLFLLVLANKTNNFLCYLVWDYVLKTDFVTFKSIVDGLACCFNVFSASLFVYFQRKNNQL